MYFSRRGENYVNGKITDLEKGNTEYVARFIQRAVGGDLFEIRTAREYTKNYYDCTKEAKAEQNADIRPELAAAISDISRYDNIFICGPCWWGEFPMAVYSQTDLLDFTGKKVMVAVTHEGSGMAECEHALRNKLKGAVFGKGLAIRGADAPFSEKKVAA
jgi:flavodoxin